LRKLTSWRKTAYFAELKEQGQHYGFVLLPAGIRTKLYNVITAISVMYVGFSAFLTFGFANFLPPYGLFVFEKIEDGWFWVDMCLNFYHGLLPER
jgi:hypothetical protein